MPQDKPCGDCKHFDPILRGTKPTSRGWCALKSIYPFRDAMGQVAPAGAKRAAREDLPAVPVLVRREAPHPSCNDFRPQGPRDAASLLAAAGKKA